MTKSIQTDETSVPSSPDAPAASKAAQKPQKPSGGKIPPPLPKGPTGRSDVAKRPPLRQAGRKR